MGIIKGNLINFSIKAMFNKSKPEETSVTVSTHVEEVATPKEIFDNAVAELVKDKIQRSVEDSLFLLVYGQECYDQTKEVVRRNKTEHLVDLISSFPKARMSYRGSYHGSPTPSLTVNMKDLNRYLTNIAYTQVYGETNENN
jgi:hypothetical protein